MIQEVTGCFFSPCGKVRKVVCTLGKEMAEMLQVPYCEADFTLPSARGKRIFARRTAVVLGMPVYAGRIPNKIMPYVRDSIAGAGTPCVAVVAFGSRAFDDALSELVLLAEANGFQVIAAAAVATEHSFAPELGKGRPDEQDLAGLRQFAGKAAEKLMREPQDRIRLSVPGANPSEKYYTPLRLDGQPAKFLKAVPVTDLDKCTHCGKCSAVCPMGSVDRDPAVTTGVCIKCQACIHICPAGARSFDDPDFCSHRQMLERCFQDRAESVFCV